MSLLPSTMPVEDVLANRPELPIAEEPTSESHSPKPEKKEHLEERFESPAYHSQSVLEAAHGPKEGGKATNATARDIENIKDALQLKPNAVSTSLDDTTPTGSELESPQPLQDTSEALISITDENNNEAEDTRQVIVTTEDESVKGSESPNLYASMGTKRHLVTEKAVHSLDPKEDASVGGEETALLKERLGLGSNLPTQGLQAPLEHSASMVPVAPSSPRQELDGHLSQEDLGQESSVEVSNGATLEDNSKKNTKSESQSSGRVSPLSDPHSDNTQGPTPDVAPSTIQDEMQMLNQRLERAVDGSVDLEPSPSMIERSSSTRPIPPETPRLDSFSEDTSSPSEDSQTVNRLNNVSKTEADDGSRKRPIPYSAASHSAFLSSISNERDGTVTPNIYAKVQPSDPLATPGPMIIAINEYGAEPQAEVKQPMIIDLRNGAPMLDTPPEALDTRAPLDRSISTMPEAPTSPQSELEVDQSEAQTPTIGPTRADLLSVDRSLASDNHRLDFVEDARSERSVAASLAPIAPNSPRFITPLLTPASDVDGFSFYEAGRAPSTSNYQPASEGIVPKSPELAPELKDALDTPLQEDGYPFPRNTVTANKVAQPALITSPLPTVSEDGAIISPLQGSISRPRPAGHVSSPSTWSINRTSGWFNSSSDKTAGRPSMEVAEGEFSRPVSRVPRGEYPPDPRLGGAASSPSKSEESRCIIM